MNTSANATPVNSLRRLYPFNAEQTVNILSEFGPLVTMFVVNAISGDPELRAGTWALILSTGVAMIAMWTVLGRLPVFPLIASAVTIVFGLMTLITGNPMWVQIKVTIFNAMFAAFLFIGLAINKNFFQYIFEKTFHYTKEGWDRFTWSFAWFFVFTAGLNEVIRLGFPSASPEQIVECAKLAGSLGEQCLDQYKYNILGYQVDGVNVWILFKVFGVIPLSGLYAWYLTYLMKDYRMPDPEADASASDTGSGGSKTAPEKKVPESPAPAFATQAIVAHGDQRSLSRKQRKRVKSRIDKTYPQPAE